MRREICIYSNSFGLTNTLLHLFFFLILFIFLLLLFNLIPSFTLPFLFLTPSPNDHSWSLFASPYIFICLFLHLCRVLTYNLYGIVSLPIHLYGLTFSLYFLLIYLLCETFFSLMDFLL